ncbi:uncharacterized protein [Leptinotarsa decemlineata]|uniref:uncharacterized protein n=1 Tax=Leptinotarsa decemlineata TaxID=7539 RepID=UPI003D307939
MLSLVQALRQLTSDMTDLRQTVRILAHKVDKKEQGAADWATIQEGTWNNFEDFKRAFKERFWGVEKQRDLFLEMNYGKFQEGTRGESRADYFLNYVVQSNYLTEKITEEKLVEMISKHFSMEIQRGIITQGLKTIEEVENYLRKIDETWVEGPVESRVQRGSREEIARDNRGVRNTDNRFDNNRRGGIFRDNQGNGSNNDNTSRNVQRNEGNVRTITTFIDDPSDYLLTDSEDESMGGERLVEKSPVIEITIDNYKCEALLDSGSEISAISEECFNRILKHVENIPILPVVNTSIIVAVGAKSQRIQQQVLLTISLGEVICEISCLIVPGLNNSIILGVDWMKKVKAKLDFDKSVLGIEVQDKKYKMQFCCKTTDVVSLVLEVDEEVKINLIEKTHFMTEKHKYSETDFQKVVEMTRLPEENLQVSVSNLGVTFTRTLNWEIDLRETLDRVRKRANLLKALRGKLGRCNSKALLHTYKTFIRPIVDHKAALYCTLSQNQTLRTPGQIRIENHEKPQHRSHRHPDFPMEAPRRRQKDTKEKAPVLYSQTLGTAGRPSGADPEHPRGISIGHQITKNPRSGIP